MYKRSFGFQESRHCQKKDEKDGGEEGSSHLCHHPKLEHPGEVGVGDITVADLWHHKCVHNCQAGEDLHEPDTIYFSVCSDVVPGAEWQGWTRISFLPGLTVLHSWQLFWINDFPTSDKKAIRREGYWAVVGGNYFSANAAQVVIISIGGREGICQWQERPQGCQPTI